MRASPRAIQGFRATGPRRAVVPWQPDKWERLRTVAALAGETSSMVDVGGRGTEMRRLASAPQVTSVNIESPCDVLVRPGRLPFADGAFATAVSCDVLEHLPAPHRPAHVAELLRVAHTRVVVCFPCGSDAKDQSERRLADRLATAYGVRFDFLDEHLACGLPRPPEVVAMVRDAEPDARVRVLFQDGVLGRPSRIHDGRGGRGQRPTGRRRSSGRCGLGSGGGDRTSRSARRQTTTAHTWSSTCPAELVLDDLRDLATHVVPAEPEAPRTTRRAVPPRARWRRPAPREPTACP